MTFDGICSLECVKLDYRLLPFYKIISLCHDYIFQGIDSILTVLYNTTAVQSLPILINMVHNSLLKMATGSLFNPNVNISVSSLPYPNVVPTVRFTPAVFASVILLGFPLVLVASSFAINVIKDRQVCISTKMFNMQQNKHRFCEYFLLNYKDAKD